jgi:mono/diheme cytochrome c family protein
MKVVSKAGFIVAIVALVAVSQAAQRGGARGGGGNGNTQAPASPVTGSSVNGKALYYSYSCYACHGYNGETGRAFVGNWSSNLASEDNFIRFLRGRANVAPLTPSTSMPNFAENTMSDKQAKDIYAYIRTFKAAQPDVKNIPLLNQIVEGASKPARPVK